MSTITIIQGNSNDKDNTRAYMVKGEKGDTGVSPTVSISKTGTVTTITITDAEGTHTAEIHDGEVTEAQFEEAVTNIDHDKYSVKFVGSNSDGTAQDISTAGAGYIEFWKRGGFVRCEVVTASFFTTGKSLYVYNMDGTDFAFPEKYRPVTIPTAVFSCINAGENRLMYLRPGGNSTTSYHRFYIDSTNGSGAFSSSTEIFISNAEFIMPALSDWTVV